MTGRITSQSDLSRTCPSTLQYAEAAPRHAMAAQMDDGRLMDGIFRWGRRAGDDGALLRLMN